MQGCKKSHMAPLVCQVIHERDARSSNPWPRVRNASHENVDGLLTLGKEAPRSPFADVPELGVQGEKLIRRIGSHVVRMWWFI